MAILQIIGWKEGLKKVAMTKILRQRLALDFFQAKGIIDDVLNEKTIILNFDDAKAAKGLAIELLECGAIVKIEE